MTIKIDDELWWQIESILGDAGIALDTEGIDTGMIQIVGVSEKH